MHFSRNFEQLFSRIQLSSCNQAQYVKNMSQRASKDTPWYMCFQKGSKLKFIE